MPLAHTVRCTLHLARYLPWVRHALDGTVGAVVDGAALLAVVAAPATAQSRRDSSGVRIVSNDRPAWTAVQALHLSAAPILVIGDRPGGPYELHQVSGVVRLADGTIVVADGGSLELRSFDSTGTFVRSITARRGDGPGEFRRFEGMYKMPGDTIAVFGPRGVSLFTPAVTFARALPNPAQTPIPWGRTLARFPGDSRIVMALGRQLPRAPGDRWVDSMSVLLVDAGNTTVRDLGKLPAFELAMEDAPRQVWFGPVASWTSDLRTFYFGFPSEYSVRAYSADGRLTRIVRRRWTAQHVTEADKDAHTIEWGRRWIRSTGAEEEQERADHRDDPYAATVPAFSQMIVDGAGRLWVRDTHLRDADRVGELNTAPVIPSTWSVFDAEGRWLCEVTMPTGFLPMEIGREYVLGLAISANDVATIALYRLAGGGRTP